MINVRMLSNSMTSMVNPNIPAVLRVNLGYTVNDDGDQIPSFAEENIQIQPQSLSSRERESLGLVDHQREYISVYAYGSITAIQRWLDRGASQLTFQRYGESGPVTWNVDQVLESYATWVRLLLARIQDNGNP